MFAPQHAIRGLDLEGCLIVNGACAGYSAEEISLPHQFQPYGDLWAMAIDGSGLRRLTHGARLPPAPNSLC